MTPLETRVFRARTLAKDHAASAELLTFYASLAGCQQSLLDARSRVLRAPRGDAPFADALDAAEAAALIDTLLRWLSSQSQPGLARAASALDARDATYWQELLERCWQRGGAFDDDVGDIEQFVAEALLQPFAESVALARALPLDSPPAHGTPEPLTCPLCAGLPVVATLREQGHGSRRSLVCGFCLTEWPMPRIVCPACGENDFDALIVYRADAFPAGRIDACESCRTYIKTIDQTADGAAVHIVDDLASVTLDLWAAENGYRKVRPNLLRL